MRVNWMCVPAPALRIGTKCAFEPQPDDRGRLEEKKNQQCIIQTYDRWSLQMKPFKSDAPSDTELRLQQNGLYAYYGKGFQTFFFFFSLGVARVSIFNQSIKSLSLTVSGSGRCCHPLSGNNYTNDEFKARAKRPDTLRHFPRKFFTLTHFLIIDFLLLLKCFLVARRQLQALGLIVSF